MRISDWSSDVCSSDLSIAKARPVLPPIALVRALQSASASARGCAPGPFHPPSPAQPARNARAATDNTGYRTFDPLLRRAKAKWSGGLTQRGRQKKGGHEGTPSHGGGLTQAASGHP